MGIFDVPAASGDAAGFKIRIVEIWILRTAVLGAEAEIHGDRRLDIDGLTVQPVRPVACGLDGTDGC